MHTEDAKRAAHGLRNLVVEQDKLVQEYNQQSVKIDWDHWKQEVNPEVASKYQAALQGTEFSAEYSTGEFVGKAIWQSWV